MKEPTDFLEINLLGAAEQGNRLAPLKNAMREAGIDRALVCTNANVYYLTGRVFRGYIYIDVRLDAPVYFVRQPSTLKASAGEPLFHIRKPEDMAQALADIGADVSGDIALELDGVSYAEACRLGAVFGMAAPAGNISGILRKVRSVKTAAEQSLLRLSGERQSLVYERIPHLFREGMTDIELQIEIERASRLGGCLGQFRVAGREMELFMGNVLVGDNADTPSPYDFAMGGEGLDPSNPIGANGTVIRPGMPVMVDVNGNYTGYMTDMTRMYYSDSLPAEAAKAAGLSVAICDALAAMMLPGAKACDLYGKALEMATEAGMEHYFMGHRSHAGFVGHGIGIEVNELPVLAPRSRDVLAVGNVIAVEPKFVIPHVGAVGIENTYIVTDKGGDVITAAQTAPIELD